MPVQIVHSVIPSTAEIAEAIASCHGTKVCFDYTPQLTYPWTPSRAAERADTIELPPPERVNSWLPSALEVVTYGEFVAYRPTSGHWTLKCRNENRLCISLGGTYKWRQFRFAGMNLASFRFRVQNRHPAGTPGGLGGKFAAGWTLPRLFPNVVAIGQPIAVHFVPPLVVAPEVQNPT